MTQTEKEKLGVKIGMWRLLTDELGAERMNAYFMEGYVGAIADEHKKKEARK